MGGGHSSSISVAPTPALPTRSSADTQALQEQQAKRYANPASFTNSILSYSNNGASFNNTNGSNTLGG